MFLSLVDIEDDHLVTIENESNQMILFLILNVLDLDLVEIE